MILKWIIKILKAINSNKKPNELAAGLAFGVMLALIPGGNLLWFALLFITFFLKINLSMEFVFLAVLKIFIGILDPILHRIGLWILNVNFLNSIYTKLYNTPVLPYSEFNNTIVMGGLFAGIILWYPFYLAGNKLILKYRTTVLEKIKSSKIFKAIKNIPLVAKTSSLIKKISSKYSSFK
jgi:uncharacterized protein (TIGR03546 family)